jgi:hypothetical protein
MINGNMGPTDLKREAPQVVQVIYTETERRGAGVPFDPVRKVKQVFTLDGELLLQANPCANLSLQDVIDGLRECGVRLGDLPFYGELRNRLETRIATNRTR